MTSRIKKRKFKAKDIPAIIVFSLLFLFALYVVYANMYNRSLWSDPKLEKRYTVATIYGYIPGAKGCPQFEYEFDTPDGMQKGQHCIVSELRKKRPNELVKMLGNKYLVKFILEKPKYSELMLEWPIKASVHSVPEEGWSEVEIDSVYQQIGVTNQNVLLGLLKSYR